MHIDRLLIGSACGVWLTLACHPRDGELTSTTSAGSGGQSFAGGIAAGAGGVAAGVAGGAAIGGAIGGAGAGAGAGGSASGGATSLETNLAVGPFSACLVAADQSVKCAGRCGPAGHGGSRDVAPSNLRAHAIAVGREFACVVLAAAGSSGVIQCWGAGPAAEPPNLANSAEIVAGDQHACSRDEGGAVTCWGDPAHVAPVGLIAKKLAASGAMTCAIISDDSIRCWGPHVAAPPADLKAVQLALSSQLTDPAHGPRFGCAVTLTGNVRCFGDDVAGVQTPPTGLLAKQIALGRSSACAITQDDAVQCWGKAGRGAVPQPPGLRAQALSLSFRGAGALTLDGKPVFWGVTGDGRENL